MNDHSSIAGEVQHILIDLIDIAEGNMRRDIDRDELHTLAESIAEKGLIAPITVRPVGERYELVAGQRRLLACGIARIGRIPCFVRELDDAAALDIMATENLERADVDVVDEAAFIARMLDEMQTTPQQLATRLKRSVQYVRDRLAVGQMPDYMHEHLKSGALKLGVALKLMEIDPDGKRKIWVGLAVEKNITIREADYWAYQHKLGTLPEIRPADEDMPGAPAQEYRPLMARCAIDGNEYPMGDTDMITVYKGHLPTLRELGRALREEAEAAASPAA